MKRVTAFIGSARKKATYYAVQQFENNLKRYGEIDFAYVYLSDYNLNFCLGCCQCFDKGEAFCPLKDDRDVLLKKMELSDGVIFASPSYAYQISARMKNFLDRFAFIFHRPRFFGKTFTAIVTQGIPVGDNIRKYLEDSGANLGFEVTSGCCIWTLDPMSESQRNKLEQKVKKCSERFYQKLLSNTRPVPSFFRLMLFRTTRSGLQCSDAKYYDYNYYKEKGWFKSDYYYETSLGPLKKLAGYLFDFLGRKIGKSL